MKVSTSSVPKKFQPVVFTITCETESDLKMLWSTFNATPLALLAQGQRVGLNKSDMNENYRVFWVAINSKCVELELCDE